MGEGDHDKAWVKLLSGVQEIGQNFCGFVDGRDNFKKLLDTFLVSTHSSFVTRQSSSAFNESAEVILRNVTKTNFKWQQEVGQLPIPYDGSPFVVCGRTETRRCMNGPGRHCMEEQKSKSSSKRLRLQKTRKGDCEATMKLLRVLKFPEHRLDQQQMPSRMLSKKKEILVDQILKDVRQGASPVVIDRFFVCLPSEDSHNHLDSCFGQAAARLSQRVHPDLVRLIKEFVSAGIRDAREVQKLLKFEVSKVLADVLRELGHTYGVQSRE